MLKIGTDICSVKRVASVYEKYGERFLDRILTAGERQYVLSSSANRNEILAGRFAAKEAVAKALGAGWHGIAFKEIEIARHPSGAPYIVLHGRAEHLAKKLKLTQFEISLSHEREFATASVIAYNHFDPGQV